jgi:hypothetical protein
MARGFEITTGLVILQGLFELSATPLHKMGTRMQLADGRVFFYALDGGSGLSAGHLNFSRGTISGHEDVDTSAQEIGDKVVTVTPATSEIALVNEFAEGFVSVRETVGAGQIRKIKSHPSAPSTTFDVLMTLYDPWTTAITAASQADLIHNPQYKVNESDTASKLPAGVPLLAVTADYYFWNQTWGLCSILDDTNCPIGSMVTGGTVAGSVAEYSTHADTVAGYDFAVVGVKAIAGVDTKYSVMCLKLHP